MKHDQCTANSQGIDSSLEDKPKEADTILLFSLRNKPNIFFEVKGVYELFNKLNLCSKSPGLDNIVPTSKHTQKYINVVIQ